MDLCAVTTTKAAPRLERYPQVDRMCQTPERPLAITMVVRKQPGGSQSCLVQCDDGKLYVLKMNGNPQGPNVLANEALGSILLRGLGLPTPNWKPVKIDLKTVRFFPELAMQTSAHDTIFPNCGIHFGSEYLGEPQCDIYDFMPQGHTHLLRSAAPFLPIYLFDAWASHQDERQCIYRRLCGTRVYDTFFVDNGHLFGGPAWSELVGRSRATFSGNVQAPLIGDPGVEPWLKLFEERLPELLHSAIATIPEEWYKNDIYLLYAQLLRRLACIRELVEAGILEAARRRGSQR